MQNQGEILFDEVLQLRQQYEAEVGQSKYRAWPLSIKTRVFELIKGGHSLKFISQRTGIPKATIGFWVQYEKKKSKQQAQGAKLAPPIMKELTVTVSSSNLPLSNLKCTTVSRVSVRTPDGFLVEGIELSAVAELLRGLRVGGV